jgi:signal transduction histidine kinase
VRLETRAADGPPLDNRSANLALLVLENLACNALQAIRGTGVVRVEATRPVGSRWCFRVSDTGGGIAPETAAHLFVPQESTKPGGTGLGLALSRQLARHLGGDLRLDHTGPTGTSFLLELPAGVA